MIRPARPLFVLTILVGSFLLFLIQPMVARMALPRLGGAPNVWNSAMLVYQALLLGGYYYAHRLSRLTMRRQVRIHLAFLAAAALMLPVSLARLPDPPAGTEALWVPLLLALSIGPVFLLVSAQAPLMQRWFASTPAAGAPWALYAASNIGSFGGLIAYPLLAEPLLSLRAQSWSWSIGYGVLLALVAACALARRGIAQAPVEADGSAIAVPRRRMLLWLALAAVPSGLMLSTTTHLTTDLVAMPLFWVIPLGLYLLSFSAAFAERRGAARLLSALAWPAIFAAGGMAMASHGSTGMVPVFASVALLFLTCVALHSRLYDLRPDPSQLTLFYLVMSAGGALGGLFTALLAPLLFDWAWEHPLLVMAALLLLPRDPLHDWRRLPGLELEMTRLLLGVVLACAAFLGWQLYDIYPSSPETGPHWYYVGGLLLAGMVVIPWRWATAAVLLVMMLAQGGVDTLRVTREGLRTRSYFGIYTIREYPDRRIRLLTHGTTLHGEQSLDPALRRTPLTYYGPGSGAGITFSHAGALFGPRARIGVVGLGTGTLACFHQPGQSWRFYEIDPAVLAYSRNGTFSFLQDCAPQARVVLGDARIELARAVPASLDLLAVDAFSSDAIPLHLLTDEAFGTYLRALSPRGVLLVHISNRFIDLEPPLAAEMRMRGLHALVRDDDPPTDGELTGSTWVAVTRDPAVLDRLARATPGLPWRVLAAPAPRVWSDDHASILPYIRWDNLLRTQ